MEDTADGEAPLDPLDDPDPGASGPPGSDDFFAATPGLRRLLTLVGLAAMGLAATDAAVSGASPPAGAGVALGGGLVWTVWRERLPTRYRVGWLAWLVAAGIVVAWAGRPAGLLAGTAGVGAGALVPTARAARRGSGPRDGT